MSYDWEADSAESDVEYADTEISIKAGSRTGTAAITIADDDRVEPASSEIYLVTVDAAGEGVELATRDNTATLRIMEGVCDRHPTIADWLAWAYQSPCDAITDQALGFLSRVAINFASLSADGEAAGAAARAQAFEEFDGAAEVARMRSTGSRSMPLELASSQGATTDLPAPALKPSDFAGLKNVGLLELGGFDASGTDWSAGVFQDMEYLFGVTLYNWRSQVLPNGFFEGTNPASLRIIMDPRARPIERLSKIEGTAMSSISPGLRSCTCRTRTSTRSGTRSGARSTTLSFSWSSTLGSCRRSLEGVRERRESLRGRYRRCTAADFAEERAIRRRCEQPQGLQNLGHRNQEPANE